MPVIIIDRLAIKVLITDVKIFLKQDWREKILRQLRNDIEMP